jgi:hypothetical protein
MTSGGIKNIAGLAFMGAALYLGVSGSNNQGHVRKYDYVNEEFPGGASPRGGTSAKNPYATGNPLIRGDTPPSEYGALLAQGAYNSIGISTAGIPGTQNGSMGCAVGVCIMFQNATGQQLVGGQDYVLGTGELYSSLSSDPRFVAVDMNNLQPGDIVVTARGSQAGHTGIVGNNNEIISNSSSGFAGTTPGTIQNNYTVARWNSGVTTRNPGQTAGFRFVGTPQ